MAQTGRKPVTVSFYLREIGAILISALAVVVFLALLSYVPAEIATGSIGSRFSNVVGSVGAAMAVALFWPFGAVAYAIPFGMLYFSVVLIRLRDPEVDWRIVGRRTSGVLLGLIALSTLATLFEVGRNSLPLSSGGFIGQVIVDNLIVLINLVGLYVGSIVLFMIALQLTWQFSWLTALEKIGHVVVLALGWLAIACRMGLQFTRSGVRSILSKFKTTRANRALTTKKSTYQSRVPPTLIPKISEPPAQLETIPPTEIVRPKPASVPKTSKHEPNILSKLPSIEILSTRTEDLSVTEAEKQSLIALGERLQGILADYGVAIEVDSIISGPVVSRFELQLAPGLKVNKITSLGNDLAREIAVSSVRVVQVIPGKSVVGIEIPNRVRATVTLREVLAQSAFKKATQPLTLALGKDISGEAVYADLERMPHLLVAGTTGSGKSVGINTMLLSLLYRLTPEDVRLILVDPKMLELSVYEGIPHLLTPVVTDMQDAAKALQWCVLEMERRYRLMMELKVRNLGGYNEKIEEAEKAGEYIPDPLFDPESGTEQEALAKLPLIVVVIDEFADMIMIVGKKIEQLIARIAQKARAAGIHLILATQRPSVDVITGLIKANIPCRISYQVSSQVDSRTILDQVGAEQLLGHGDMLYLPPGSSVPERVHGAFVSDDEVIAVIEDWRQRGKPDYVYDVVSEDTVFDIADFGLDSESQDQDDVFQDAVKFVLESRRASASALQTKFQIGWNKASRLMDQMAKQGIVSEPDQKGRREVLAPAD